MMLKDTTQTRSVECKVKPSVRPGQICQLQQVEDYLGWGGIDFDEKNGYGYCPDAEKDR